LGRRELTKDDRNALVAGALLGLGYVWLALKGIGALKIFATAMGRALPAWFPSFNLVVLPILVGLLFLRVVRPLWGMVLLTLATLFCYTLIGLSYDRHPTATIIVHPVVLAEMFWIIPWVRKLRDKRRNRVQ